MVVAYFKVLSQHLLEKAEERHTKFFLTSGLYATLQTRDLLNMQHEQ
jgi:hypothetical protein